MGWDKLSSSTLHMVKLFHFCITRVEGKMSLRSVCLVKWVCGLWFMYTAPDSARPDPNSG